MAARKILILGASYGSLRGVKLGLAGHDVTLVCLPQEAAIINSKGAIVRMPVKGRAGLVEVSSRNLRGKLVAKGPAEVDPKAFDLVALAMQEPQYKSSGVRELLDAVAKSRVPCMSIMNMPPLPYLARIPGIDPARCADSYTDPTVWASFDPKTMTLCSPDPGDSVPLENYGTAARSVESQWSAARAVGGGPKNCGRVDRLVQSVATQRGKRNAENKKIVSLVDTGLVRNRRKG